MKFPEIDPVFLSIGPLKFRWYGLMYVITFVVAYFFLLAESRRKKLNLNSDDISDLIFYGAAGVILGGRLGYILFYDLSQYLAHPLEIFAIWQGGMSFHGGMLGVITAFYLYARKKNIPFFVLNDMVAQCAPIGLGLGRVGNFINGELYGRVTEVSWGVIFPGGGPFPRHPSQLYEAFLEGILLFIIVRIAALKTASPGIATWTACAGYGLFRFIVEFFRQPDAQIGFLFGIFSMGQMLSLPMFLVGSLMLVKIARSEKSANVCK
jgi:phosphatidylglycerol---prolipoprotein diacylglyceryl transferase